MTKLKFAGIQINTIDAKNIQERDANLMHASQLINELEAVDLIVLPELFTCGYSRETFEHLAKLAEDEKGKSFEVFSKIALERNKK